MYVDTDKDFELLKGICQIKKLLNFILFSTLVVTFGCAKVVVVPEASKVAAKWFESGKEFKVIDRELDTSVNYFFDPVGEFNLTTLMADVIVTNWANSPNKYSFDIVSGQKYYSSEYCKEDDVWKGYGSKIFLPPYNVGFIPRLLDQTKKEQKVIFFGETFKNSLSQKEDRYSIAQVKVRVIGGIIEQSCARYPCDEPGKWDSRVILIGVDQLDPQYKEVKNLKMLSKFVDLDYLKAFMENGDGRIVIQDIEYPGYKTFGDVIADKAMKYAVEKGHLFSIKEINSLRRSCEHLYLEMINDRAKVLNKEMDFTDYFREFYKTNAQSFSTCAEFVKFPTNTFDNDIFWYFEYMHAFFITVNKNFVFDCSTRTWMRNYRVANGKVAYDINKELRMCSTKNFNQAFEGAISVLTSMQSTGADYFDFIEYDSGKNGTTNKFYNFVKKSGKKQSCNKDSNAGNVFPTDISWLNMPVKEVESIQLYKGKKKNYND